MEEDKKLEEVFVDTLLEDAAKSLDRLKVLDDPSNRRDAIRNAFAAIEGALWWYKKYIIQILEEIEEPDALLMLALSEKSYSVSDRGKVTETQRFIAIPTMIKLVAAAAQKLSGDWRIDYSGKGWANLKRAVSIRNRVTHPKSANDLIITTEEIATTTNALLWFLEIIISSKESHIRVASVRLQEMREFLEFAKTQDNEDVTTFLDKLGKP